MRVKYKEKREVSVKPWEELDYYNDMVKFAQIVTKSKTKIVTPAISILGGREFRIRFKKYYNGRNITENHKLN